LCLGSLFVALFSSLVASSAWGQEPATPQVDVHAPQPQPQSWNRVQYLGGAIGVSVGVPTWKNTLTVSPRLIQLKLQDNRVIEIDPQWVTALHYSGSKAVRVGASSAALMAAPVVGLFIMAAKSTSHHIGIEYVLPDGRSTGILLCADKKNYAEILEALKVVTKISGPAMSASPGKGTPPQNTPPK
jgi:hypothetical protein